MPEMMRLKNGEGPEVTVPDWVNHEQPTPEQWLDWFGAQSRQAQLVIAEYHLETEATLARVQAVLNLGGPT